MALEPARKSFVHKIFDGVEVREVAGQPGGQVEVYATHHLDRDGYSMPLSGLSYDPQPRLVATGATMTAALASAVAAGELHSGRSFAKFYRAYREACQGKLFA